MGSRYTHILFLLVFVWEGPTVSFALKKSLQPSLERIAQVMVPYYASAHLPAEAVFFFITEVTNLTPKIRHV